MSNTSSNVLFGYNPNMPLTDITSLQSSKTGTESVSGSPQNINDIQREEMFKRKTAAAARGFKPV